MSTVYDCSIAGPAIGLRITQTFTYVNGDSDFVARYSIQAQTVPTTAIQFRLTALGAFDLAGARDGAGFHDPAVAAGPQDVGVFSDETGTLAGFAELASTPWAAYMAADAGTIEFVAKGPPQGDTIGPGLDNSIAPFVAVPGAGVQFDRYASTGLAAGATDTFDVDWFFGDYPGLSLDATSDTNTVGATQTVTATSLDHGQPVVGGVIRYAVTGANPTSGVLTTGSTGIAAINWTGSRPGDDTVTAYLDADRNGAFDPSIDTQQAFAVTWSAPPPPPVTPPVSTGAPTTTGVPRPGQTLTCSPGSWSGSTPQAYAYQWLRDGAAVTSTSASGAYVISAADAGHSVVCAVTAANTAGSASARSAPVAIPGPLRVALTVRSTRIAGLLRSGVTAIQACSAACTVKVVASLDAAQAHRLGLPSKLVNIGSATRSLPGAGSVTLRIGLSARVRSRLRRVKPRRVTITLHGTATDAQGQAAPPTTIKLAVKR